MMPVVMAWATVRNWWTIRIPRPVGKIPLYFSAKSAMETSPHVKILHRFIWKSVMSRRRVTVRWLSQPKFKQVVTRFKCEKSLRLRLPLQCGLRRLWQDVVGCDVKRWIIKRSRFAVFWTKVTFRGEKAGNTARGAGVSSCWKYCAVYVLIMNRQVEKKIKHLPYVIVKKEKGFSANNGEVKLSLSFLW